MTTNDAYWHRVLKKDCDMYSEFMHSAIDVATHMSFVLVKLQALKDEELAAIGIARAQVDKAMQRYAQWHENFKKNFNLAS